AAMPKAIVSGSLIPMFCTAAKKDLGVPELLDGLARFAPSPADVKPRTGKAGDSEKPIPPEENAEFVGQGFKTIYDKFVGHMSFTRLYSGKLKDHATIHNLRTHKTAHFGTLLRVQGKTSENDTEAGPGEIIAVAKVEDLKIGDTLAGSANAPLLPLPPYPEP